MNAQITEAMQLLRQAIETHSSKDCVSVTVFFNSEGNQIEYTTRTAESLKATQISMRNLRGEWIR